MPERYWAAAAIDERFGPLRDESSFAADREMVEKIRQDKCRSLAQEMDRRLEAVEYGIEIMTSVYGSHPKPCGDWLKPGPDGGLENSGIYTRKSFDGLTRAETDPAEVEIGGRGLSEREFAALAMFAATDADIAVEAQKQTVSDPAGAIGFYRQEGYTEAQAERIIADSIAGAYTLDVLHGGSHISEYFDTAMNGGRARADEALRAYPGDKTKLARILGSAVKCAGMSAGVSDDDGVPAMVKVGAEMLSLMGRDPELEELAKQSFEREEEAFCRNTGFMERSFDEMADNIRRMEKFVELQDRGRKARRELMLARADGKEPAPAEKKGYLRDILTANLAEGMRLSQLAKIRSEKAGPEGAAFNYEGLREYCTVLGEKVENANEVIAAEGGSLLPCSAPILFQSAMKCRVTKTPGVLVMVTDEKKLAAITRTADKIIAMDRLDEKPLDYLVDHMAQVGRLDDYAPGKAMKSAVRAAELDKQRRQGNAAERGDPKPENSAPERQAAALGV